jgi:hypothetical protein
MSSNYGSYPGQGGKGGPPSSGGGFGPPGGGMTPIKYSTLYPGAGAAPSNPALSLSPQTGQPMAPSAISDYLARRNVGAPVGGSQGNVNVASPGAGTAGQWDVGTPVPDQGGSYGNMAAQPASPAPSVNVGDAQQPQPAPMVSTYAPPAGPVLPGMTPQGPMGVMGYGSRSSPNFNPAWFQGNQGSGYGVSSGGRGNTGVFKYPPQMAAAAAPMQANAQSALPNRQPVGAAGPGRRLRYSQAMGR